MDVPVQADKCWCDEPVLVRIGQLYRELIAHDGFGELRVDVRILKRKQKEVIITCGKQYRFVVDAPVDGRDDGSGREPGEPERDRAAERKERRVPMPSDREADASRRPAAAGDTRGRGTSQPPDGAPAD